MFYNNFDQQPTQQSGYFLETFTSFIFIFIYSVIKLSSLLSTINNIWHHQIKQQEKNNLNHFISKVFIYYYVSLQ